MGFMDKVKSQATSVAQKAQEGVKTGQSKLEEAQAKKRQDALLRDLGAQVYAGRTGTATAETAAETERIVAELKAMEAESMPISTAPTADQQAPKGGAATAPEEGEFKLDDL